MAFDFDALEQNYQASQRAATATPPKKKKNFWLDQISTGTGILGGIAGSLVAPIAGTAGGAALGSGLGEAIENLITGDSIGKNVVKETALGGVFGAGPIKLLKGGAALATGKGVQAASQAAMTPLRQKAGQALVNASDDLAVKQFRLTPTQLKNFQSKFGEDAGQVIKKYGFQTPEDIATKGIQPLQSQFDEIVSTLPGVSRATLEKSFQSKYKPLLESVIPQNKTIGQTLKKQSDDIFKRYGDVIDAKELNSLRKEFDSLVNYTEKAANPAMYGVNKRAADAVRNALQESAQSQGLPLKDIGRELNKVIQLSDIASKQSQLGRGSLPVSLPNLMGGAVGGAGGGLPGALAGGLVTGAINSNAGRRVVASGAERAGTRLLTQGANTQTKRGIAGRLGAVGALNSAAAQPPATLEDALLEGDYLSSMNSENNTISPTTAPAPRNANIMGEQYQTSDEMSSASPYSKENLMADIQRDPRNAEKYIDYYASLDEIFNPKIDEEAAKPLSQGQQERADLIRALDLTEGTIDQGSINYGPVGSRIEGIKSMFNKADPETLAYKNTISGLRAAITKARAGASLTAGELKMLQQYTPSDTDSEQVVRSKLAQLRSLYGYAAPQGGGTTLEDALLQYQR